MKILISILALGALLVGLFIFFDRDNTIDPVSFDEMEEVMEAEDTLEPDPSLEPPTNAVLEDSAVDTDAVAPNSSAAVHVFDIDMFNFGYSVGEIRVRQGDTVTINVTNSNGVHDFVIDEFNVRTSQIGPGRTESVTFVPDRTGTFEYYCSVGSHRASGMVGRLIVE